MNSDERWHELVALYLTGQSAPAELAELESLLRESDEARGRFHRACRIDSRLRREAESIGENRDTEAPILKALAPRRVVTPIRWLVALLAAAAMVMLSMLTWSQVSRPKVIATLVSAENAAWESSLPTAPGSELTKGYLKLTAGIGTVRFASGAEVTLEAPAHLVLESPMRGTLLAGAAMIDVPEPAIGFVLATPDGYAVDHGTKFAVKVIDGKSQSDFEVLSGKISVFLPSTGEEAHLTEQTAASISGETLTRFDEPAAEEVLAPSPDVLRIGTNGRATTVIRNNKMKWTRPDLLMASQSRAGNGFDRHAMFSFDLSKVELAAVGKASLRLNLVPSGVGFASRLPLINRFAVYGLTNAEKRNWALDSTYENAPAPEDGVLLGKFEIPRSRPSGAYGINGEPLLQFARHHVGEAITLILVRETTMIEGHALVHAFASDSHPEASGPILEFSVTDAP